MRFALTRRREAFKVEKIAAVPLHGLESDADGVLLHVGDAHGNARFIELPIARAVELREYLTRATASLEHWEKMRRDANKSAVAKKPDYIPEIDWPPTDPFEYISRIFGWR